MWEKIATAGVCGGVLFCFAFVIHGCSSSSPSSPLSKQEQKYPFSTAFTVPGTFPSDGYGYFFAYEGQGQSVIITGSDSATKTNTASSRSVAYFGTGDTVGSANLNSTAYSLWTAGDNSKQYEINPATFHTDGTNNIFTYTVSGNTYTDTMNGAIGNVTFNSPTFKQSVSKSSALSVTWTASSFDSDYVQITFNQNPAPINPTGHDTVVYYNDTVGTYNALVDDNGSLTIPSSVLSSCTGPTATLTISRGYYKEVTHGGKNYVFFVWSSQAVDVLLH